VPSNIQNIEQPQHTVFSVCNALIKLQEIQDKIEEEDNKRSDIIKEEIKEKF